MKIEPVTVDDAYEILQIYAPYVRDTAISFEWEVPTLKDFTERINCICAKYPYIKAVGDDGVILGYAYADTFKNRAAYDWSVETAIYVRHDVRRKGVGLALYAELERLLKNMGVLNMNACIAVPNGEDEHLNCDSVYFHKKMGFELVGRFHNSGYKFDTWYDMVWMERQIAPHKIPPKTIKFGQWR